MELTILMPCLNEEATIAICINKALHAIEKHGLHAEVLISDNGSTDNSVPIALELGARVINVKEKGYGNALRKGIENAHGKYVIMADSDDSYDFNEIFPFVLKLREGYDLVMGNRFVGGIEKNAMPFLHQYLGNPVLTFIGRLFFKIKIGDFHCGFRAFNRQSILEISLLTTGMEFASEMIVKSSLNNYKISEISVKLYPDGRSRAPHLQTWNDGWRHLRFLLLNCPKWLFLFPGTFLFLFGLTTTLVLLPKTRIIGHVAFDVHTMLYMAFAVIIGFQLISLFYFSKIFAEKQGYPPDGWMIKFQTLFPLEKLLLLGTTLFITGILLTIYSMLLWTDKSFGVLEPTRMLRIIIPSITFLMLGGQIIFNGFFASILKSKA